MSKSRSTHLAFMLVLVVVGLAFCQPLHVFPLVNFVEELLVTLGVLFAAGLLFLSTKELKLSIWLFLWLGLGVLFVLSGWLHPAPFVAAKMLVGVYWLIGLLALLIGDQVDWSLDGERLARWLGFALVVTAMVCAVGGLLRNYGLLGHLWQFYFPEPFIGRMVGLVGHSNFFAYICLFGLLGVGYLFSKKHLPLWFCLFCVLILVSGILGAGSRSVLVAWLATIAVLLMRFRVAAVKPWVFFLIGAFVFYWLFRPVFLAVDGWLSVYVVKHGFLLGGGSANADIVGRGGLSAERLAEWKVTLELIRQHFWGGIGIGNYAAETFRQHLADGTQTPGALFLHSHNSPMQLVVELGVAGLLWLLALVGIAGAAFWQATKESTRLLPLLVVLAIQVYGLFEFPLWLMHFLALHMLLLGALGGREWVVQVKLGKLFAGLAFFAFAVGAFTYVPLAERFNWSYRQYFLQEKVTAQDYAFVVPLMKDPLLEPYGYQVYFANFNISEDMRDIERKALEGFRDYLPYGQTLVRLAVIRQIDGDKTGAQQVLAEMRAFYGNAFELVLEEQISVAQDKFPAVDFSGLLLRKLPAVSESSQQAASQPPVN
ncbi:MAG: Wzy polymerase domain-containing protein [Pseudomonas sp.]|uniref:Wzy polymerase domain-containing protein n=1 Tax=Pseudomonas sp. TaxID=306 RepID=UPI0030F2519D